MGTKGTVGCKAIVRVVKCSASSVGGQKVAAKNERKGKCFCGEYGNDDFALER